MSGEAPGTSAGSSRERDRARLELLAPGYLERARDGARRLSQRGGPLVDVTMALAEVEETAAIDLDVPTVSRQRAARLVKIGVKRLISWYLRYLVQQMSAMGSAVGRLGTLLAARMDRLEERTAATADELERLRERIERLEGPGGHTGGSGTA